MSAWATLLIIALLFSGCDDSGAPERSTVTMSGDTIIVENHARRYAASAEVHATVRYGSFESEAGDALSSAVSFAVGDDGTVFLFDRDQGIKRFHADGQFLGTAARLGSGPAEVQYATAMAVGPSGEVAALDIGNRRIGILYPSGANRTIAIPDGMPRYHEDGLVVTEGGLRIGIHPPFRDGGYDWTPRLGYLSFAADGASADSILIPDHLRDRCPVLSERPHRSGFWEDNRSPYLPKMQWAMSPDGTLAVGCPSSSEFDVMKNDGIVRRIRWPAEPLPLESEFREFLARWVGLTQLPAHRPVYARLILPGDGRVWVWPNQPGNEWVPSPELQQSTGASKAWELSSTGAFEVFGPDGEWIGSVPLPEEVRYSGFATEAAVVIRGDTIWAISRDELDVNYITRYEVLWGETGGSGRLSAR